MPTTKKAAAPKLTAEMKRIIDALGDNWMIRMSQDGVAHGGFVWGAVGVWTEAEDFTEDEICRGLHGQGPGGYGYAHEVTNGRFEFCETEGQRVCVGGDKIKVRRARILWIRAEAFVALQYAVRGNFPGSLDLSGCDLKGITLPTSVGGSLYLRGCDLKGITLPTSVGGYLDLRGCVNVPKILPTKNVIQ